MTVYIEDTILENFLVTYLIISIIFSFIKEEKSNARIIFASIFASLVALLYPLITLNGIVMFILKIFVGYIIVLISYKTNSIKKQIFFLLMFLMITAIYGGINLMIYFSLYGNFESSKKLPTLLILACLFLITYLLKQCQLKLYSKKNINNFVYEVTIKNDNYEINSRAYLDTGNILIDDNTKKPIILINFKMFNKLYRDYPIENFLKRDTNGLKNGHYISVKTATSIDKILAFEVDCLEIYHKDKTQIVMNPVLALSKIKISGFDCDIILNSKLIGD